MVTDHWAAAWSSHNTEELLTLFTDDCVYEDVTFGVVNRGKKEVRAFAETVDNISTLRRLPGDLRAPDRICQTRTWNAAGAGATAMSGSLVPRA